MYYYIEAVVVVGGAVSFTKCFHQQCNWLVLGWERENEPRMCCCECACWFWLWSTFDSNARSHSHTHTHTQTLIIIGILVAKIEGLWAMPRSLAITKQHMCTYAQHITHSQDFNYDDNDNWNAMMRMTMILEAVITLTSRSAFTFLSLPHWPLSPTQWPSRSICAAFHSMLRVMYTSSLQNLIKTW